MHGSTIDATEQKRSSGGSDVVKGLQPSCLKLGSMFQKGHAILSAYPTIGGLAKSSRVHSAALIHTKELSQDGGLTTKKDEQACCNQLAGMLPCFLLQLRAMRYLRHEPKRTGSESQLQPGLNPAPI